MSGLQQAHRATRRGRLIRELRGALAAACFLTRLPLAGRVTLDGDDVARAAVAFPLVGGAIGAGVGALASVLHGPLSPLLAAALALAAGTLLTGALHLDALADSADALGTHTRERALAVMRDSTIGSFGASAIALDLLVKTAALSALVAAGHAIPGAIAAGALSRTVPVLLAAALPYARAGSGAGVALTHGSRGRAAVAAACAVAVALVCAGARGGLLIALAIALAATLALAYRRWLAGVTGDMLGASLELTETGVLVIAAALWGGR